MQAPVSSVSKVAQRRSQRVTLTLPVIVTSLDPRVSFQETCHTMVINAHGCSVRSPRSLELGIRVRLDLPSGKRSATGKVVMGGRSTKDNKSWEIGLELDKPCDLWGIEFPAAAGQTSVPGPAPGVQSPSESAASGTMQTGPGPTTISQAPPRAPALQPASPAAHPRSAALPSPAAASPAAPPWDEALAQFEPALRERARAIASEFESDYRKSLGELLLHLRADLEERASGDWERLKSQTQESLQEAARRLRQEADEKLASWQREADSVILQHLGKELEAGLKNLARDVAQQLKPAHDQLLAQTIEELHGLEAQVEQQNQVLASQAQTEAALEERVEEALKTRDYMESLAAKLPQTVDQRVQEALSAPLEELHGLEAQVERQNQVLTSNVEAETALRARVEALSQARDYIDSLARELPQSVDQRVQEVFSASLERLQGQLEEQFSPRRLEERLIGIGAPAASELRQRLFEDFDRHEREFLDRVNVRVEEAVAAAGSTREFANQWRAELAGLLQQAASDLQRRLEETMARRWQETQSEFQKLEEQAGRARASAEDLRRLLEALREQRESLEIQNIGLQQQSEEIRAWVRRESEQIQKVVQSAVAEARGEIRGRLQQGVETTQDLMEQRWREGAARFEQLAARPNTEVAEKLEQAREQMHRLQEQAQRSVGEILDVRLAEVLERFKQEADALSSESIAECQTELGETLESVSIQLRDRLNQKPRARRALPADRQGG